MKSPYAKPVKARGTGGVAPCLSRQRGLSLIELMISITIGLLILAALSTLFVNQSRTRSELDKSNRMIDNGRYSMEVLADTLSLAGYYGEFDPNVGGLAVPAALPDPCSTNPADMESALLLAVQGYNAQNQTSQIGTPPCGFTYVPGSDRSLKAGSDIVVIRRASTATPIVQAAALNGTHYIQASLCQFDAELFRVRTSPAEFTLRTTGCVKDNANPKAVVRNFLVQVYFVSPDNTPGDGIPTLKRYELSANNHVFEVAPLVEGIEYVQIDYGLDTGSDGAPDTYVAAPTIAQWPSVVTVKMNILARNTEPSKGHRDTKTYTLGTAGVFGPFNDEFKRHAFTRVIRLINPAGRRDPL